MKNYTISWTESVDCQLTITAETEADAIAQAKAGYMAGRCSADTTSRPYADNWEVVDEEDCDDTHERTFLFRISAVVDNSFKVTAKNRDDALRQRLFVVKRMKDALKLVCDGNGENWDYDGNVNNEGEEEI